MKKFSKAAVEGIKRHEIIATLLERVAEKAQMQRNQALSAMEIQTVKYHKGYADGLDALLKELDDLCDDAPTTEETPPVAPK